MIKRILRIKGILALILVTAFSMSTMGVAVSDNDESAFITKAEFDSLKSSFQAQIDQYNSNIDSKIDNAIAAYLAGIKIITNTDMAIKPYVKQLTFVDQPQWLVRYSISRLSSARTFWGSSRLSGLSYLFSETSSIYYGAIPLSAKPFSYSYSMSYYNISFYDSGGDGSVLSIVESSRSVHYKIACQDDKFEFWYVAFRHNFSLSTGLSKSVALDHLRPWGIVSTNSGSYILKDLKPFISVGNTNLTLYGALNYFLDQVTWQFADSGNLSNASYRFSHYLSYASHNFIQFVLECRRTSDGTLAYSARYSATRSRYLRVGTNGATLGGIGGCFSALVFSASDTLFGGYLSGYGNIPMLSAKGASIFGANVYEPYGYGASALFGMSGQISSVQLVADNSWKALYSSKYSTWRSWSSTNAVAYFPQPYTTKGIDTRSIHNEILYNNGYRNIGLCDGLPLCGVYTSGYAEIKIKCSTWKISRLKSRSGTSFSWLNSVARSYDSDKELRSALLHISTDGFNNASGNKTTLRLCDSNGKVLGTYAQSIGNSHSYNYNLSYNSSTSKSENEYNVWKVFVPVKKGDTIYVKFEPNDPYGLTGIKIVDASVTLHSG